MTARYVIWRHNYLVSAVFQSPHIFVILYQKTPYLRGRSKYFYGYLTKIFLWSISLRDSFKLRNDFWHTLARYWFDPTPWIFFYFFRKFSFLSQVKYSKGKTKNIFLGYLTGNKNQICEKNVFFQKKIMGEVKYP